MSVSFVHLSFFLVVGHFVFMNLEPLFLLKRQMNELVSKAIDTNDHSTFTGMAWSYRTPWAIRFD